MTEVSRQPNIQAVAWVLLGTFSQFYIENQEQMEQVSDFKSFEFG